MNSLMGNTFLFHIGVTFGLTVITPHIYHSTNNVLFAIANVYDKSENAIDH